MGRRRCDHSDADNLESVELEDGHALQCPGCQEIVSKDWWLQATDAEILKRKGLSAAALRSMREEAKEKPAKSGGDWKEAQQANGSFLLGALGWVVFFLVMWNVLNSHG